MILTAVSIKDYFWVHETHLCYIFFQNASFLSSFFILAKIDGDNKQQGRGKVAYNPKHLDPNQGILVCYLLHNFGGILILF